MRTFFNVKTKAPPKTSDVQNWCVVGGRGDHFQLVQRQKSDVEPKLNSDNETFFCVCVKVFGSLFSFLLSRFADMKKKNNILQCGSLAAL